MLTETSIPTFDPGSFRDPAGRVIIDNGRIFRSVAAHKADDAKRLLSSSFYRTRAGEAIVGTDWADALPDNRKFGSSAGGELLLEHERIEPITYPFEWPFSLLKKAAEFHLEIHCQALEEGFDLSDSSAYNVQFRGCRPVFLDVLSFKGYQPQGYWHGYKQFCEQFLGPLLITAKTGVPYNDWYKGSLNGLDIRHVARLLPLRVKLSPFVYLHVILHARMMDRIQSHNAGAEAARKSAKGLTAARLKGLLESMRGLVRGLKPKGLQNTYWKDYEFHNSYSPDDMAQKRRIVQEFVARVRPQTVLDIGCNSGDFSELCLSSGANRAISVDFDLGALEAAVSRAQEKQLNLLPLYLDLMNPSPSHGWAGTERQSFETRVRADALIALALLHHLIIGKNVPMADAVSWIIERAPTGLIEFVPRGDPMVEGMLRHREDIFPNYTIQDFRTILSSKARIVAEEPSSQSGRTIFCYER